MRGDERRGVVYMVMPRMPSPRSSSGFSPSFIRLEMKARDGGAHAALHLFDDGAKESAEGRGEDLLGEGEDVGRDSDAQEEERGFVAEVIAVPAHQVWGEGGRKGGREGREEWSD